MSTSYYLHCYTHNESSESGPRQPSLDILVDAMRSRHALFALADTPIWEHIERFSTLYFDGDILPWFIDHRKCAVGIRDEYGQAYDENGECTEEHS